MIRYLTDDGLAALARLEPLEWWKELAKHLEWSSERDYSKPDTKGYRAYYELSRYVVMHPDTYETIYVSQEDFEFYRWFRLHMEGRSCAYSRTYKGFTYVWNKADGKLYMAGYTGMHEIDIDVALERKGCKGSGAKTVSLCEELFNSTDIGALFHRQGLAAFLLQGSYDGYSYRLRNLAEEVIQFISDSEDDIEEDDDESVDDE